VLSMKYDENNDKNYSVGSEWTKIRNLILANEKLVYLSIDYTDYPDAKDELWGG